MTEAEHRASADAQQGDSTPRLRGLSSADAIAVVFIAAIVGIFVQPHSLVGYLLLGAMALLYAVFRVTRGLPMRRRALAAAFAFIVPLTFAAFLVRRGY